MSAAWAEQRERARARFGQRLAELGVPILPILLPRWKLVAVVAYKHPDPELRRFYTSECEAYAAKNVPPGLSAMFADRRDAADMTPPQRLWGYLSSNHTRELYYLPEQDPGRREKIRVFMRNMIPLRARADRERNEVGKAALDASIRRMLEDPKSAEICDKALGLVGRFERFEK